MKKKSYSELLRNLKRFLTFEQIGQGSIDSLDLCLTKENCLDPYDSKTPTKTSNNTLSQTHPIWTI